ncbi:ATP-dependent nuclease [Sporosarcina aquimarina]|uniref:ATP-dependent nuclease n=1 Tax=Sporosarcina aquimarina TaxID=114975 RepID=UPI001C8D80E0|nr:AAA family ATPase [Sporosarcina aquimarina]MBY0221784.1 AAA family ATPase [Sporosarcina aquimarina]
MTSNIYIKELKIKGYKRFAEFSMKFNEEINVIIGENESGKSTILEALEIVLNQTIFNYGSGIFEQYFTIENVRKFQKNPVFENLPEIEIEVFFNDSNDIKMGYFNGYHSSSKDESKNGIRFRYSFDESFKQLFEEMSFEVDSENIFIPTDYYNANWETFAGRKYNRRKVPIKNLTIDNSVQKNNLFDSYTKRVYNNKVETVERNELSHNLKSNLNQFLIENEHLLRIGDHSLGFDERKSYFEQLIDLKSNGVSLQNMGKGRENLIKTEIALDRVCELILLEEPENHLSYLNTRKLISEIQEKKDGVQIILTTHSPLIVSRMNLQNTLLINENQCHTLKDIPEETANFFKRTDNMNILNFILSKKVIIVEGHSEYILLPTLVKNSLKTTLDKEGIEVISGAGLTYMHYIEVSKVVKNNLLVITDNDKKQDTIEKIKSLNQEFLESTNLINLVCDSDIKMFTFEVCLYKGNKETLKTISKHKPGTTAIYEKETYDQPLAYMLKNKTEAAMSITEDEEYKDKILLPQYIKEGVLWLTQS